MLIGRYKKFPSNIHGIVFIKYQHSEKSLQQAILGTFYRLNSENFELDALTPYLKQNCEVGFEFGVADGFDFNFLGNNELDQCLKNVNTKELETLDFFLVVRYHLIREGGKRVPLRFDYHMLRFTFLDGGLELRIRHEKGTQHVPLDDLTDFLIKQINVELSRKQLIPLFIDNFQKVSVK